MSLQLFKFNKELNAIEVIFKSTSVLSPTYILDIEDVCTLLNSDMIFVYDVDKDVNFPISLLNGVSLFRLLYPTDCYGRLNGNKYDIRRSNMIGPDDISVPTVTITPTSPRNNSYTPQETSMTTPRSQYVATGCDRYTFTYVDFSKEKLC